MPLDVPLWTAIIILFTFLVTYLSMWLKKPRKLTTKPQPAWNFKLKKLWAFFKIREWKKSCPKILDDDVEKFDPIEGVNEVDSHTMWATNKSGFSLYVHFNRRVNRRAEIALILNMPDKTTYRLPNQPDTMIFDAQTQCWNAGNLKIMKIEANQRYRIVYSGFMVKGNKFEYSDNDEEMQHVQLNCIWIAASNLIKIPENLNNGLMAECIALENWRDPNWFDEIQNFPVTGYDQFGNITGTIQFNGSVELIPFSLYGVRERRWSKDYNNLINTSMNIKGALEDGSIFNLNIESYKDGMKHHQYGSARLPNGQISSINWSNVDMYDILANGDTIEINIQTDSRTLQISGELMYDKRNALYSGRPWDWESTLIQFNCINNNFKGFGLITIGRNYLGECNLEVPIETKEFSWMDLKDLNSEVANLICVAFYHRAALCPQFVGAKAASLAFLSSVDTDLYKVPNGFCLTIRALETQIRAHKMIEESIKDIETVNTDYSEKAMRDACKRVSNLISTTPIYEEISAEIEKYYNEYNKGKGKVYFAVRSSGIGEDSTELSAAGQNDTILGCETLFDIYSGVQKCWASLFSFHSVEYRRTHGQVVNCGMGVVIQRMVDAESAGVMMTRHPSTGNPSEIVITSNFGLGESVVSGDVEPDTFIVGRDIKDNLSIKDILIGSKTHRVCLDRTQGSRESNIHSIGNEETEAMSLSERLMLLLGQIAIQQEKLWGSPRDIEWAVSEGVIYLVQARPITTLQHWTEYELLHELDSPTMSETEMITYANTGEVLPSCISPLAYSVMVDCIEKCLVLQMHLPENHYHFQMMSSSHHRVGLNVYNLLLRQVDKNITTLNKVTDVAVFGHIIMDDNIHRIAMHRNGIISFFEIVASFMFVINSLTSKSKKSRLATDYAKKFHINLDGCKTAIEMNNAIDASIPLMLPMINFHNSVTSGGVFSQLVIFSMLLGKKDSFSNDNYTDIGTILSSISNVISAEIPVGLKNLAKSIETYGKIQEFREQKPENAEQWLKENCPDTYKDLQAFLKKHGHRAICELDFLTDTWELDTTNLITALQAMLSAPVTEAQSESSTNIMSKLVSPMNWLNKSILRFMIPMCQSAVTQREITKNALIVMTHKLRMAYRKLAKQMMKEWLLPDEKLIFFMTRQELFRFLNTRDSGYITKALLRRRKFAVWNKFKFPELNIGFPKPIGTFNPTEEENDKYPIVRGTPVQSGSIKGTACVILYLSEINQLKNGDILITHSTDIGWSPYFPLLSGVVTELGGLISHGAVVAREYGLPCIVGAHNATSVFKTGDIVLLNSSKGFIQKCDE